MHQSDPLQGFFGGKKLRDLKNLKQSDLAMNELLSPNSSFKAFKNIKLFEIWKRVWSN